MGLFDRFFGKSKPKPPAESWELRVQTQESSQGVRFGIALEHLHGEVSGRPQRLPVRVEELPPGTRALDPHVKTRLDRLWDLVRQKSANEEDAGVVLIPAAQLARLDPEDRGTLGLTLERGWKVDARVTKPLGQGAGQVELRWTAPGGDYLGARLDPSRFEVLPCGLFDREEQRLRLLPPELLALRDAASLAPARPDTAEEARYIARIQEALQGAKRAKRYVEVTADLQLERETWVAPDHVEIHIQPTEDGGLELQPRMKGVEDAEMAGRVLDADPRQGLVSRITGEDKRGRVRVALSPEVKEAVQVVRRKRRISREEREAFLENPRRFLQTPEEMARSNTREPEGDELREERATLDLRSLEDQIATLRAEDLGDRVIGVGVIDRPEPEPFQSLADGPMEQATGDELDEDLLEALSYAAEEEPPEEPKAPPAPHIALQIKDNVEELAFDRQQHLRLEEAQRRYPTPASLQAKLFPHQEAGYAWLRLLSERGVGGLLADDMGLGKTLQVIALLAWLHERGELGTALIVAPKSVITNWRKELRRFCPAIRSICEHTGQERRLNPKQLQGYNVILTTYDTLRRDQLVFGQLKFSVMACDEAQAIKNPSTLRASACRAMQAKLRLALTATPVENRLQELWAIMDFAQPGLLGSLRVFERDSIKPIEDASDTVTTLAAAEALRAQLGEHYLRRTKEDHLRGQLPPKTFFNAPDPFTVALSEAQLRRYRTVQAWFGKNWSRGEALNALRYLMEICIHPLALRDPRFNDDEDPLIHALSSPVLLLQDSPKLASMIEHLEIVQQKHEKMIIFVRSRRVQKMIQALLQHRFSMHVDIINGETAGAARQQLIDDFNGTSGFNVLILSPDAAGVGLNITGANHVFHLMRLWNPARENQATDRAYRIGQERPVTVYVPIVTHPDFQTVEQRLDTILQAKRKLAEHVIQPREGMELTQREIQDCVLGMD